MAEKVSTIVPNKSRTFQRDMFARKKIRELIEAGNANAEEIEGIAELINGLAPNWTLWGTKKYSSSIPASITPSTFGVTGGFPEGATGIIIEVLGSVDSASGVDYANHAIEYTVKDTDNKVITHLYDNNTGFHNQYFMVTKGADGVVKSVLSAVAYKSNEYVGDANSPTYFIEHLGHLENGTLFETPEIKTFTIKTGLTDVYRGEVTYNVYVRTN